MRASELLVGLDLTSEESPLCVLVTIENKAKEIKRFWLPFSPTNLLIFRIQLSSSCPLQVSTRIYRVCIPAPIRITLRHWYTQSIQ